MNLRANTTLHDREKMSGFQRGRSGSRPCLERRNSRFRFAHPRERFINRRCGS
jgi:hypothetical protein